MVESPRTRASLLLRLRDRQDADAWRQFLDVYGPLVYGFFRQRGLQDADAADLMQEVLRSVAGAAGRLDYDPERGSFRGWLFTVTRNRLYSFLESRQRQVRGTGDTGVQQQMEAQADNDNPLAEEWEREYERRLSHWAMEQVRGEFQQPTWSAFHQTAVEGKTPKEVAVALGMSPGAVYVAKSRVLARIRERVQEVQEV